MSKANRPRGRPSMNARFWAVLGLLVALATPGIAWADAGGSITALKALLSNASSLTAGQMANQTGTGLIVPPPSRPSQLAPQSRVILWDELRQRSIPAGQDGSVSMSVHLSP